MKLQSTVSAIRAMLHEAEKRHIEAEDVKDWLKKLKDVVYDADDLLDDYSTEALRRRRTADGGKRILKTVCVFFSPSNQLIYAPKMAHRVKKIRKRLVAIKNDRSDYKFEHNTSLGSLVGNRVRPETYPFECEPYVVGRDKDREQVIEFLLNPEFEENVSILPIVGYGGLGKTTLARLIFNDDIVKENFVLRLWVCVSTNFNIYDILRKIALECNPQKEQVNLNVNELQKELREALCRRKFLLVLDDVWNENRREWLKLQGFLTDGAKGSKVLVTTRTLRVAKTMAAAAHELSGLADDESLSLLMRMAMKQEHEWKNRKLEIIAKEILEKCAGVPLAITTIGRLLLFTRNTEEDWLKFKSNELSKIVQAEDDIMPSLKLSYDFLPSHLKWCFAYCSLFPKDYELYPSELIDLWMAQGFIKSTGNRRAPEEIGQEYLMELVSRSFFQELAEDLYGNIIKCKMHDLMHDLAVLVAGDNCLTIDGSHVREAPEGARHVSVVNIEDYELKGFEMNRKIRSLHLLVDHSKKIKIPPSDISCFRKLRALRLHDLQLEVLSDSIGNLKHLRSLHLPENHDLRSLPNSISRLCNLETLNLSGCWNLRRLPAGVTKLVNLRQLDVSECYKLTHMPMGIGKLTSLQVLGTFVVGRKGCPNAARLNELSKLTGLRKNLSIRHLERLGGILLEKDASFVPVERCSLQSLELHWKFRGREYKPNDEEVLERFRPHQYLKGLTVGGYGGAIFSSWISQLHKLVEVYIWNCHHCKCLPPLDHLPSLRRVSLANMSNLEWIELSECWTPHRSFFPSLEELTLTDLDNFRGWERSDNVNRNEGDALGDEEEGSSLSMLPIFCNKVTVFVAFCPRFSYTQGHQRLQLGGSKNKLFRQLLRNVEYHRQLPSTSQIPMAGSTALMMSYISISSVSLSALTSLSMSHLDDTEHLPLELFQSLPSLRSLVISNCDRLKSLSGWAILRYLTALERLEVRRCKELDFSTEDDEDDGCLQDLQMRGHHKLHSLIIGEIEKMASLPWWFQYLCNMKHLLILSCTGLKSLPGSLILGFLTTLESLVLDECSELDFSGELEGQEDIPNLQFSGPATLRKLEFQQMERMKTLPWWIKHLNNLEDLSIRHCSNLEALPDWFPQLAELKYLTVWDCGELSRKCQRNTGEDWPKISHIQDVNVYP